MQDWTQLGIAGLTLGILFFIVRYFVKSLDQKDQYIRDIIIEFEHHVELCNTNFLKFSKHFSTIARKQTLASNKLTDKIELLSNIKRNKQ